MIEERWIVGGNWPRPNWGEKAGAKMPPRNNSSCALSCLSWHLCSVYKSCKSYLTWGKKFVWHLILFTYFYLVFQTLVRLSAWRSWEWTLSAKTPCESRWAEALEGKQISCSESDLMFTTMHVSLPASSSFQSSRPDRMCYSIVRGHIKLLRSIFSWLCNALAFESPSFQYTDTLSPSR